MRWFRIRRASIPETVRTELERHGVAVMQQKVAFGGLNYYQPGNDESRVYHGTTMSWLTEQYDRAERKETWQITMEVAVTVLVAAELFVSGYEFHKQNVQFDTQVKHQDDQFKSQMQSLSTQLNVLQNLERSTKHSADFLDQNEERRRKAENSKPVLVLSEGPRKSLLKGVPPPVRPLGFGPGARGFELVLTNYGDADATNIRIYAYAEHGIADIDSNDGFAALRQPLGEVDPWGVVKEIRIPDPILKEGGSRKLSLSISPADQTTNQALIHFKVLTNEFNAIRDLGAVNIILRR
jgi:hypothetical protein